FDHVAPQWDELRTAFFSDAVRDQALVAAGVQAGQVAADIGAGSGFMTAGLLRDGLRVIAVDQSEAMLAEMRRKFGREARVEYRLGQAEALPLETGSVDYAFANMYLHHVESPPQAIQEMVRPLKPGGKLVITDLDEHNFEFLRTEQHDRWLGFKREEVRRWFVAAGLQEVQVDCVGEDCCADSAGGDASARVSIFIATGQKAGADIKAQVRAHYGAIAGRFNEPVMELVDSRAAAGCCGPVDCCGPAGAAENVILAETLYQQADLAGLPDSVTDIALGCGNPTAIAGLKPGETVLDLGSGGGIDCFLAARQVGPGGRVIGVDMTDSMLALANKNKAKLGLANVEFRKGEIEQLPVESNSVDVIISNCVINLSPDKDAVFREIYRVLKPGGRVSVSDMVTEGEFSPQLQANIAAWAGCISGALDQAVYLQKMAQAGLVEVQVESRVSHGLEQLDSLDEASREMLTRDIDVSAVPADVRLYSARIVARKPAVP
ncbi:MAG: arsenite methyltransferase, partial [Chloroflexota bacterium]